ncbi:hypothetical protein LVJ82_03365 [Vitreoscilla massiliensis]|uniref:Uncharacterized protein n=1 Tax=Vitreoscilla massiliensis TaxID=1689272 RepID=A0ABY4E2N6_9NEIS|nr:hypothetical protein [Vitreoscilla massiliensis]UOO90041.1 hypothetical protein LVJ82_03365 [Vitreoscilla massiliensis]
MRPTLAQLAYPDNGRADASRQNSHHVGKCQQVIAAMATGTFNIQYITQHT